MAKAKSAGNSQKVSFGKKRKEIETELKKIKIKMNL